MRDETLKQKHLPSPLSFLTPLLNWYQHHKRDLPWRHTNDPYKIWLSEIMLQQTTVAAVIAYYEKFTSRWPTVKDLARASQDDVLAAWAGLGYYSRARNLHKTAQLIASDYKGIFPKTAHDLRQLPGIGPYTAGAIAAIAYSEKSAAVDGNVVRVLSRVFALDTPMPLVIKDVQHHAQDLIDQTKPGSESDLVQALMELGATICVPRNPKCLLCPWQKHCLAFRAGNPEFYPVKLAKKLNPVRTINVYVLENDGSEILMTRRPDRWMLGGMMAFPSSALTKREDDHFLMQEKIKWKISKTIVKHSFTHFDAELIVHSAKTKKTFPDTIWIVKDHLLTIGLPTLFAKVAKQFNEN